MQHENRSAFKKKRRIGSPPAEALCKEAFDIRTIPRRNGSMDHHLARRAESEHSDAATSLAVGFRKIDEDYAYLLQCAREVFDELGEVEFAELIEVVRTGKTWKKPLPSRGAQVISIAFQMLNLVEENAANQAMRARESAHGVAEEPGLWGSYLTRLREKEASRIYGRFHGFSVGTRLDTTSPVGMASAARSNESQKSSPTRTARCTRD